METCPTCKKKFIPTIFPKDGGSLMCSFCDTIYHHCKDKTIRICLFGPQFCKICTPRIDIKCPFCHSWLFRNKIIIDEIDKCNECQASFKFINLDGTYKFL